MRRTTLLLALTATAALLALGCDRGEKPSTSVEGQATALAGDETDTAPSTGMAMADALEVGIGLPTDEEPTPILYEPDAGADPIEYDDSEVSPEPIEAAWTDGAEISTKSKLSFTVTNVTVDDEVAFMVSVVSRSILGEGERPLAELVLGPGESEELHLGAAELPVQSDVVVSQMAVGIRRGGTALGYIGGRRLAAMRFYRHAAGLGKVRAYTEGMLMSEMGGVLYESDLPEGEMSKAALESKLLGYKDDGDGEPKPVSLADTGLVSYDGAGNVLDVTTGMALGKGDASGEGAISVPEEDPTVDGPAEGEMEVADE